MINDLFHQERKLLLLLLLLGERRAVVMRPLETYYAPPLEPLQSENGRSELELKQLSL